MMAGKAEKAALEILQGQSAYKQLYHQLEGEQAELLWQAMQEQQMLTICQSIWHRKQLTCQAWRDAMHEWLSSRDPWESLLHELRAKGDGVTMTRTDWEKLAERVEKLKGGLK